MTIRHPLLLTLLLTVFAGGTRAAAHPGHGTLGVEQGILHHLLEPDHLLASALALGLAVALAGYVSARVRNARRI